MTIKVNGRRVPEGTGRTYAAREQDMPVVYAAFSNQGDGTGGIVVRTSYVETPRVGRKGYALTPRGTKVDVVKSGQPAKEYPFGSVEGA